MMSVLHVVLSQMVVLLHGWSSKCITLNVNKRFCVQTWGMSWIVCGRWRMVCNVQKCWSLSSPWREKFGLPGPLKIVPVQIKLQLNYSNFYCAYSWFWSIVAPNMKLTTDSNYHKTSCIRHTKSQNLNISCLLLQWSLPNPLKPGVKLRMKM